MKTTIWIAGGLLLGAVLLPSRQAVSAQTTPPPVVVPNYDVPFHGKGKYLLTPSGRVYYEVEGQGPPVFLVAGGPGGGHASFHPWFGRLAAKHTVVYFDNIGRGRSDRLENTARHTIERDADDIEALRKALGYDTVSLIGHSYGGMPALAYALKYPSRCARLVLSNTLHGAESFQQNIDSANFLVRNQFPEVWRQVMDLRQRGVKSGAPEYQERYGEAEGDMYWYDPNNAAKMFRSGNKADGFNPAVYLAMLGDDPEWVVGGTMKGYDPRPRMKTLAIPTLVCVGRYDRVATPKIAGEIKAALPPASSQLIVFERSGHRPWVEETNLYFQKVGAFLADQPI